ncbi:unnamed protein product [Cochlearia groenlandica]
MAPNGESGLSKADQAERADGADQAFLAEQKRIEQAASEKILSLRFHLSDSYSNKRKYDDQSAPPRRPTGFSSGPILSSDPISASAAVSNLPPSFYNIVPPPPMDEIINGESDFIRFRFMVWIVLLFCIFAGKVLFM